jgi:hypothetical protein
MTAEIHVEKQGLKARANWDQQARHLLVVQAQQAGCDHQPSLVLWRG